MKRSLSWTKDSTLPFRKTTRFLPDKFLSSWAENYSSQWARRSYRKSKTSPMKERPRLEDQMGRTERRGSGACALCKWAGEAVIRETLQSCKKLWDDSERRIQVQRVHRGDGTSDKFSRVTSTGRWLSGNRKRRGRQRNIGKDGRLWSGRMLNFQKQTNGRENRCRMIFTGNGRNHWVLLSNVFIWLVTVTCRLSSRGNGWKNALRKLAAGKSGKEVCIRRAGPSFACWKDGVKEHGNARK